MYIYFNITLFTGDKLFFTFYLCQPTYQKPSDAGLNLFLISLPSLYYMTERNRVIGLLFFYLNGIVAVI
ncbi:MAG: hypothetical protein EA360_03325 [Balneolaceae bacterium]|nr:MAG: hypothetical protein EA360_03325 [Balneolaceae bacterium]